MGGACSTRIEWISRARSVGLGGRVTHSARHSSDGNGHVWEQAR
jgi:hypothetical protein